MEQARRGAYMPFMIATCIFGSTSEPKDFYQHLFQPNKKEKKKKQNTQINCVNANMSELLQPF